MTRYETRIFMGNIDYAIGGGSGGAMGNYGNATAAIQWGNHSICDPSYDWRYYQLTQLQRSAEDHHQRQLAKAMDVAMLDALLGRPSAPYVSKQLTAYAAPLPTTSHRSRLLLLCPINP